MKFTTAPLEIKFQASETDTGRFTGYVSTYGGSPDSYGDIIEKGAFAATLERHRLNDTRPALLWQHDQTQPIGIWESFQDTDQGLQAEGVLNLDTVKGREAHALMKQGALALSIGFTLPEGGAELRSDGVRVLKSINLVEVSAVSIPANANARIHAVKAFDASQPDRKAFEMAVREMLGLNPTESKRLLENGWNGLASDQRSEKEQIEIVKALKLATEAVRGY